MAPGRTLSLVCLINEAPAMLICELPTEPTAHFRLQAYDLWPLRHTLNQGIVLRDLCVPVRNLLQPRRGNGLTIAYHGLNNGRVALCANAAGSMRRILAGLLPWVRFRVTYGQPLSSRELICRRLGRLAALIVGCDALAAWCSHLLDSGYRCEMEGIVAKVFASDALREAAVEIGMRTHGGRCLLQGHSLGDDIYDYLAPCIYEGESELLSLAFVRSLLRKGGCLSDSVSDPSRGMAANVDPSAEPRGICS